jgi:hypothetical protein
MKLVGSRTGNWTGQYDAPGFIYNSDKVNAWKVSTDYRRGDLVEYKNFYYAAKDNIIASTEFNFTDWTPVDKNKIKSGLLSGFSTNAGQGRNFYDIESFNGEDKFDRYSLGLIGYRSRSYLDNLGINDTTQVKFYQGFVKEKGTKKSIDALKQLSFGDNTSEISIHEDWAFKVGEYGSLDTNRFIDLTLSEDNVKNNPSSIIVEPGNALKFNESYELNNGVFRMSSTSLDLPLFLTRTPLSDISEDLQTAGFADPDDVDYTVFNLATHTWTQDEINNISVNDTIWCAIDYKNSWNIFKIANPEVAARGITNLLDNVLLITTADVHNFGIEDIVVLKDIDKFSGIYQITGILDDNSFTVTYAGDQDIQDFVGLELENTAILKLDSIKLTHASQVVDLSNSINWDIGNKIYVTDDSTAGWAIYEKSEPWAAHSKLNSSRVQANARLGSAISISDNGKFIAAGRPGANNGLGEIVSFSLDKLDKFVETSSLGSTVAGCTELGAAVTNTDTRVIAGAPGTNNNSGVVVIYDQNTAGIIIEDTVIAANTQNADGRYGQSVATTQDGQWLFVGAPGLHSVFVYWYQSVTEQSQTFTPAQVAAANDTFNLNFTPDNIGLLRVTDNQYTYVPYRDYTITGNVLTVSNISAAGNYGNLTVTQQSNYVLYDTLVGASGSEFGWSVSCSSDGRQLIVGCPGDNPGNHAASGSTMIFDRSVEKFIKRIDIPGLGTYSVNSFHTLNNTLRVLVNNQLQVRGQDYTVINNREVQFINEPPVGAVIEIESNKFSVIQMRTEIDPQDKSRFGHCVKMHRTGTSVYVGAPFHNTPDRFEVGVIHRFVNQGRRYGTLTGLTRNPTVVVGDTIRINDFVIEFTGTTLNSVVTDINNAGIPGIQAANVNGYLRLTSNASQQPYNLSVAPCHSMTSTSPLQALGLEVYELSQVIDNPTGKSYDKFGYSIDVNADDTVLAVGSRYAETEKLTTFDIYPRRTSFIVGSSTQYATDTTAAPLAEATTFDSSTTTFNDNFESGAVWMLQSMTDIRNSIDTTDKFTSIQQLTPATIDIPLSSGLEFGSSLILRDQDIIVGASGLSAAISGIANHGGMITFKTTGQFGWDRVSQEDGHVDVNGITKSYIYDKNTRTILGYLDYLDPAKGRILGQAEQELTYKTDYDPAAYNVTDRSDVTESKTLYWSTMQVGQLWWDLSAVRYIEYEQKDITYRTNRWGQQFPGSEIKVYEWVESEYPPSQWVAQGRDGVPLYADDSAYATISYVDKITNVTTAKYYFWVGDRTSVPKNALNRKISASDVANYIDNPLGSGIKYLAAIRNDAVAIFNVIDSLKNDDIILHIDYATKLNESIIHSEYSLMSETGSKSTLIPEAIYKKLIDSLSGLDIDGNPVPDQRLPVQLRYGISNTPRQSMFVDRRAAISEMLDYINLVLRENIISRGFDLSGITGGEPPPDNLSNLYDVKTNNRTDFGFININLVPQGYRVLILNDEEFNNQWTIHTKQSNGTWKLTRIQSYNMEDYWDYQDWYASGYDATLLPTWTIAESINLNDIINTVRQGDTIKILNNGQNRWVLLLVNNNAFDLIGLQNGTIQFKDNLHDIDRAGYSFDSSVFDSNVYDKNPSVEIRKIMETIKNNILSGALDDKFVKLFFVFIHYILNEQKNVDWLFKTSFINVLHKIAQLEQLPLYRRNNQDNYRQYIEEVKPYHTTIREYIFNYEKRDEYRVNFSDFDVVPYYDAELNTYRSPTTPADPRESSSILQDREAINLPVNSSWLANHDYYVSSIEIEYAGSGYRDVPLITITGSLTNDNARARAVITSGRITSVIVTHPGSGYYTTPTITLSTASQDPGRLSIHLANDTVRKIKTTMIYDRFTYGSSVRVWEANTAYRVGDIVSYNGRAYRVDTAFTSTVFFNSSYLTELPRDYFTNANDRIAAYYVPKPGIPGASAELLQSGIDYPGVIVDSFVYDESGGFDASGSAASFGADFFDNLLVNEDGVYIVDDKVIDKIVEGGSFDDSYNNLPASTVLVDGSSFVDTFSSHAPEELLPGRMFDTMSMTISTANVDPLSERYNNWKNFEGLYVARIIIADPGEGYSLVGTSPITVTISQGDSLTTAVVNRSGITLDSRGNVVAMTLAIQGAGYRSRPNVVITGSNVSPALAYVEMSRPYWETDTTLGTFNYNIFKSQQSYSSLNRLTEIQDGEDLYSYHRIHPTLDQTTLVTAITDTATTLQVTNAAVITDPVITFANVLRNGVTTPVITSATPGSIMIGGEKINFWRRDNNTLSRLMRGADGTGARNHAAGATVTNMGTGNDLYRYFNSQQNMASIAERLRFKRVDLPNVVVKRKIEPVYNNTQRDNYTFSAQGVAVRTIVFNDRGSIPNPLTLENENPLATDHSNEIITTDQNAVSPATETGFFNGNTAIIRYIKGIN